MCRTAVAVASAAISAVLLATTVIATPSSGLTATAIARAMMPDGFKVQAHTDLLHIKLDSKGPVDAVVNNNKLAPGGTVGWHTHTGPVFVLIRSGEMSIYDSDCSRHVVFAGEAFVENVTGDTAHTVRNEGASDLEWTSTSLGPVGFAGRVDRPAPPTCGM
jgi:quercetin dioxygenase-like cupin family protein